MMIGKSIPEYIFIRTAIAALRLVTPLCALYVAWSLFGTADTPDVRLRWLAFYYYASLEVAFFTFVYLPRRYHLQKTAIREASTRNTRRDRRVLFQKCIEHLPGSNTVQEYLSGWFFGSRLFRRDNVVEWLLWALFSTTTDKDDSDDEMDEYVALIEDKLGHRIPEGYNKDTPCMRLTFDPVRMVHRPLLWYLIVGIVDFMTSVRLYALGFRHYGDKSLAFRSFPPRPFTFLCSSHLPSRIKGFSYWYRPHRTVRDNDHPILFLHGIGIGLYPYSGFLADLATQFPDVGIIVPEFLSISSRITSPPLSRAATVAAIRQTLDTHALPPRVVVAAHSYGTVIAAQLWKSSGSSVSSTPVDDDTSNTHASASAHPNSNSNSNPDLPSNDDDDGDLPVTTTTTTTTTATNPSDSLIAAALLVDPIPILLHLSDVAYNFVYRTPHTANEWLLWYFASRDPDVSRTLSRHFFWADNVLFKDDLQQQQQQRRLLLPSPGRRRRSNSIIDVAVALSGRDQVVNAEAVRRYLTGEDEAQEYWRSSGGTEEDAPASARRGQLEVLCYPELDHAMIFHTKERRRRLLRVLDRFARRLD